MERFVVGFLTFEVVCFFFFFFGVSGFRDGYPWLVSGWVIGIVVGARGVDWEVVVCLS